MTFETRQAYSEVCAVLEYMPDEYVNKIPEKIIKLFQSEKPENYEVKINRSNPLDKNCLSRKTMVLIAMLNYQYWCSNKKVEKTEVNEETRALVEYKEKSFIQKMLDKVKSIFKRM